MSLRYCIERSYEIIGATGARIVFKLKLIKRVIKIKVLIFSEYLEHCEVIVMAQCEVIN